MIAIYTRQSLDKKDSISIETQVELCKKELDESSDEFKVYTDKGYSGKNTNRPDFERLMSDIESGLITKVIAYKLDRISRSVLDFASIIQVFQKHKVEFVSHTEKFDTSTPVGKAMLHIVMVFAQLERETIQLRVLDNYYQRGKKGFFLGGPTPFGYSKIKTKINNVKTSTFVENPETTPVVKKMYEMYADTDMSLGKLSSYLNDNNIPAAKGGKWDSCKVSRILRSPVYVKADVDIYNYYINKGCKISNDISDFVGTNGCYLYGKREANERKYTKVEEHVLSIGLHEGIINSSQWLMVQYKLDSNKQIKNSGRGKHSWLSGVAKCGYCGYAVSVIKAGHGDKKYFNCRGKTNLKICKGHSVPIDVNDVEDIVQNALVQKIEELKNISLSIKNDDDTKINQLKMQVADIDGQIENLINQLADGSSVVNRYISDKITSLDSKKNVLLDEIRKATVSSSRNVSVNDIIKQYSNWDAMDIDDKKSICSWFINRVNIYDNEININWKV